MNAIGRSIEVAVMVMMEDTFAKLPDHLLIAIFIRIPISEWPAVVRVKKHWAAIFRGECFWHAALLRRWPSAGLRKKWPGPIPRGLSRRRYEALHASENIVSANGDADELVGHAYLYLKEQLEVSGLLPVPSILHGTIIDQFIACGNSRDKAYELATQIWLASIDHVSENLHTFVLLKHLAVEEVLLPYPYSRSRRVQWRVFDKLFTDFRDCFSHADYCNFLSLAKNQFQSIPPSWVGF